MHLTHQGVHLEVKHLEVKHLEVNHLAIFVIAKLQATSDYAGKAPALLLPHVKLHIVPGG